MTAQAEGCCIRKKAVHPSIPWSPLAPPKAGKPQGERIMETVMILFFVHGESLS